MEKLEYDCDKIFSMKEGLVRLGAGFLVALGVMGCENRNYPEPAATPVPKNILYGDGYAIIRLAPDKIVVISSGRKPIERQAADDMSRAMAQMGKEGCIIDSASLKEELGTVSMEVSVSNPSQCLPGLPVFSTLE
ncbi:hypothetical protein HY387_00745 [Candidatus Daviesbacteria bacterium]|nr:hypothetical protein [Candidatus Daviesbacteria bacterium]